MCAPRTQGYSSDVFFVGSGFLAILTNKYTPFGNFPSSYPFCFESTKISFGILYDFVSG